MDNMQEATIQKTTFGTLADGQEVHQFTFTNSNGVQVQIINYGGIIISIKTPDKAGRLDDVVLGFDELERYVADHPYFGSIVGRSANRIEGAAFTIDGQTYSLAKNVGEDHLHGGIKGFNDQLFDAEITSDYRLKLTYLSKDGEEGYPGNLELTVCYSLSAQNELKIDYHAETDKATPVNITNHSYFNLLGDPSKPVYDHLLKIDAGTFTPNNEHLIPTGQIEPVQGTPVDFKSFHTIGERIEEVPPGYDHNFVLNKNKEANPLQWAATLKAPKTGRVLQAYTTQPAMQLYSSNYLDGSLKGRTGIPFEKHASICLEMQGFPNAPNQPAFPSTVLQSGEEYHHTTVYQFLVNKES